MQMWHICHFRVVLYCAVCISSCVSAAARMITSVTQAVGHIWDLVSQRRNYIGDYCSAVGRVKNVFLLQLHFLGRKKELVLNL